MKLGRRLRAVLVSLLCIGSALPARPALAVEPTAAVAGQREHNTDPSIRDLALGPGGLLQGTVVDQQGQPLPGTVVVLQRPDMRQLLIRADRDGRFALTGLRGGVYQLVAGKGKYVCRLWSPGTAPPNANDQLLVILGMDVHRGRSAAGQFVTSDQFLNALIFIGAFAVPIIVHNSKKSS